MELDGYCEELKLAFEYQGKQHHQKMPHYFHKQKDDFSYQLEKDETKRELCRNQGVNLIEVPYTVPMDELPKFVMDACQEGWSLRSKRLV